MIEVLKKEMNKPPLIKERKTGKHKQLEDMHKCINTSNKARKNIQSHGINKSHKESQGKKKKMNNTVQELKIDTTNKANTNGENSGKGKFRKANRNWRGKLQHQTA